MHEINKQSLNNLASTGSDHLNSLCISENAQTLTVRPLQMCRHELQIDKEIQASILQRQSLCEARFLRVFLDSIHPDRWSCTHTDWLDHSVQHTLEVPSCMTVSCHNGLQPSGFVVGLDDNWCFTISKTLTRWNGVFSFESTNGGLRLNVVG